MNLAEHNILHILQDLPHADPYFGELFRVIKKEFAASPNTEDPDRWADKLNREMKELLEDCLKEW